MRGNWHGLKPAKHQEFKSRAAPLRAQLVTELPPGIVEAAQERGQARDLDSTAAELLADANLIGLLQSAPDEWFGAGEEDADSAAIEALIEQRNQARANRDFAAADSIRDQLTGMGVVLEDANGVTRWRRKDN